MKKLLILAYDFPPLVSVGGMRPYSWYKHAREFGIDPVVITRQWANKFGNELDYIAPSASDVTVQEETDHGTIIRTPYTPNLSNRMMLKHGPTYFRWFRRLVTGIYELGQYYATIGPRQELYHEARRYLRKHRVDVIIATGEPFVLFKYASMLSKEFGIPWIADYRDAWSLDDRRKSIRLSKSWNIRLEQRCTQTAAAVSTVSEFLKYSLNSILRKENFEVIPNGYDADALAEAEGIEQGNEKLRIVYIGSIYKWFPIESFLEVCDSFVRANNRPQFEIQFVGIHGNESIESLLKEKYPDLRPFVTLHGKMPHVELVRHIATANIFLLFNNYAQAGTKVYDYLALRRLILLCYSNDAEANKLKQQHYNMDDSGADVPRALEEMIEQTNAGIVVRDKSDLFTVLTNLYAEFLEQGSITCNSHGVERYSRKIQSQTMMNLVKQIAAG